MTGLTHRGIVRIRTAGSRTWLTVTVSQIWQLACDSEARRKRLEKYQARMERKQSGEARR